jgi:hypothetical protein
VVETLGDRSDPVLDLVVGQGAIWGPEVEREGQAATN